ncbi:hypothetical protein C8R43DRAFT_1121303 [Mycena crocata]|nr:hypothetical protein C8R43DRAFT_1121303 [Mycena crocata]
MLTAYNFTAPPIPSFTGRRGIFLITRLGEYVKARRQGRIATRDFIAAVMFKYWQEFDWHDEGEVDNGLPSDEEEERLKRQTASNVAEWYRRQRALLNLQR